MDDNDAVAGEMNVQLQAVSTEGETVVERRKRVFGSKRRSPPMRENLRTADVQSGMRTRHAGILR
jgi:hypothetical protein